jgi:hypothetical protein
MSGFGKRSAAPSAPNMEAPEHDRRTKDRRRSGGGDRRKSARRAKLAEGASHPAASYREWAESLRAIAHADHHGERRRTLLKLARDYDRIADILDTIDKQEDPINTEALI